MDIVCDYMRIGSDRDNLLSVGLLREGQAEETKIIGHDSRVAVYSLTTGSLQHQPNGLDLADAEAQAVVTSMAPAGF